MPENESKLSKNNLSASFSVPKISPFLVHILAPAASYTQLLFASSERPSTKEKSSQNYGCTNRFCANKKMLARQSRYVPPCTCGTNLQKDATRRPCQHTTIAAALSSRNGFPSGPLGLGGRARARHPEAPESDPPAVENRTPSNPKTKNPRTIFGTIFRSVFWT